jgi:DNA polymerase-3 subunit beta
MFKVESKLFIDAVSFVSSVVMRSKTFSPVLQNIKFVLNEQGLHLETTNTDISCFYKIESSDLIKVSRHFATTVPALKLFDIVKKIGNGEKITCKFIKTGEREMFAIVGERSKFLLDCLPADLYPSQKNIDSGESFNLKASSLLNAINRVKFSVCTDEARFYINGILLDFTTDSSINVVSTDSHRLSIETIQCPASLGYSQVIIPRRSIAKVVDILSMAKEDDVSININKTKIRLSIKNCTISSSLIEGEFPQYQRVVPTNLTKSVKVSKQALQKAIDTASAIYSGSNYNVVKLSLANGSRLTVIASKNIKSSAQANADSLGMAKYDISCESDFSDEFSVSYNYSYVSEALASLDSDECYFKFSEASKPCLVVPCYPELKEDEKDEKKKAQQKNDYKFIIMPIRL